MVHVGPGVIIRSLMAKGVPLAGLALVLGPPVEVIPDYSSTLFAVYHSPSRIIVTRSTSKYVDRNVLPRSGVNGNITLTILQTKEASIEPARGGTDSGPTVVGKRVSNASCSCHIPTLPTQQPHPHAENSSGFGYRSCPGCHSTTLNPAVCGRKPDPRAARLTSTISCFVWRSQPATEQK